MRTELEESVSPKQRRAEASVSLAGEAGRGGDVEDGGVEGTSQKVLPSGVAQRVICSLERRWPCGDRRASGLSFISS